MRYYIGLGGNVGDVAATMRTAMDQLNLRVGQVSQVSSLYDTTPMGVSAGARYLNAVLGLDSEQSPQQLLASLQQMENEAGRVRREIWGPRPLDLDLLQAGDQILSDEQLTIPHSGCYYRRFVLDPLVEVAPNVVDPRSELAWNAIRQSLLPRPLTVFIHVSDETLRDVEIALSPSVRSALQLRETQSGRPGEWTIRQGASAADTTFGRIVIPADRFDVSFLAATLTAMVDEPRRLRPIVQ
jgi:2-amino-4-hydroxy-6-hydroxymethyldihydropteridine diphosphokinase